MKTCTPKDPTVPIGSGETTPRSADLSAGSGETRKRAVANAEKARRAEASSVELVSCNSSVEQSIIYHPSRVIRHQDPCIAVHFNASLGKPRCFSGETS